MLFVTHYMVIFSFSKQNHRTVTVFCTYMLAKTHSPRLDEKTCFVFYNYTRLDTILRLQEGFRQEQASLHMVFVPLAAGIPAAFAVAKGKVFRKAARKQQQLLSKMGFAFPCKIGEQSRYGRDMAEE